MLKAPNANIDEQIDEQIRDIERSTLERVAGLYANQVTPILQEARKQIRDLRQQQRRSHADDD